MSACIAKWSCPDTTPPDITVSPESGNYPIAFGDCLVVTCNAEDTESGVANISATLNGVPISSPHSICEPGSYQLLVAAVDHAGNVATAQCDYEISPLPIPIFEPPLTRHHSAFKLGSTLPIKFHLVDWNGAPVEQVRDVRLEVQGPDQNSDPVVYVFLLADRSLKFDPTAWPPHYVAIFHTRRYSLLDGGVYTAAVYEEGVPTGCISFMLSSAPGAR